MRVMVSVCTAATLSHRLASVVRVSSRYFRRSVAWRLIKLKNSCLWEGGIMRARIFMIPRLQSVWRSVTCALWVKVERPRYFSASIK